MFFDCRWRQNIEIPIFLPVHQTFDDWLLNSYRPIVVSDYSDYAFDLVNGVEAVLIWFDK